MACPGDAQQGLAGYAAGPGAIADRALLLRQAYFETQPDREIRGGKSRRAATDYQKIIFGFHPRNPARVQDNCPLKTLLNLRVPNPPFEERDIGGFPIRIVKPIKSLGHPALASLIFLKYAPEMEWLAALLPVVLMGLAGLFGFFIKSRIEELRAIEEQLREQRREVYRDIIAPYILLFSDFSAQGVEQAKSTLTSPGYRRASFELNFFGSDEVIRAYNDLMQHAYKADAEGTQDGRTMLLHWGTLILEIRKSLGNKRTNLNKIDMLRGMIKDIESLE